MKVFIINGAPRTGKDSFVHFCQEKYTCQNYSTIDQIKDVAKLLGWDGTKTPESRHMLSDLKDLSTKYFDGPLNLTIRELLHAKWLGTIQFFFIHAREPEEIERFKEIISKELGLICKTILVKRVNSEEITNHADAEVEQYNYDITLYNNGSLEEWKNTAHNFIEREHNFIN